MYLATFFSVLPVISVLSLECTIETIFISLDDLARLLSNLNSELLSSFRKLMHNTVNSLDFFYVLQELYTLWLVTKTKTCWPNMIGRLCTKSGPAFYCQDIVKNPVLPNCWTCCSSICKNIQRPLHWKTTSRRRHSATIFPHIDFCSI